MPQGDDGLAWTALTRCPALDVSVLSRLLGTFGDVAALLRAGDRERIEAGLPPQALKFLRGAAASATPAERAWLTDPRHHVLPFTDPRFPKMLLELLDCPIALYVDGDPHALCEPQIAIVGSRAPTPQGRVTARDLAEELAGRGCTITSGLAEGIDAAAHEGALAAAGQTIGVLGTGIDIAYPPCNARLAAAVSGSGALVCELPLGTPPRPFHFPRRNRLIAGLSLGTLVVEAAQRSGSLITARSASQQGRALFAVPGSIHNPLAKGPHALIRQGAKLTETADDILCALNFPAHFAGRRPLPAAPAASAIPDAGMDKDRKILLDALGFEPMDLDGLVTRTGFKAQAVSSMMLILELEGHVQAAPGGRYSRVANRSRR